MRRHAVAMPCVYFEVGFLGGGVGMVRQKSQMQNGSFFGVPVQER